MKRMNSSSSIVTGDKKRVPDTHFTPRIFWLVSRSLWKGNALLDLYRHGFFPSEQDEALAIYFFGVNKCAKIKMHGLSRTQAVVQT
jgi:hypothetical protein